MDKYDIVFCFDNIKKFIENFLKNRKELYKKYILAKKSWMMMEYYKLRTKRSSQYAKKHDGDKPKIYGIEKVIEFKKGQKYIWDIFKPIHNKK